LPAAGGRVSREASRPLVYDQTPQAGGREDEIQSVWRLGPEKIDSGRRNETFLCVTSGNCG
jgi:hypothetical protein